MDQEMFIKYAQNFEDLMLWRALKHVESGFYIDLGAAEPEMHSVTKAFYDRGWRGINVEPGSGPYNRLNSARTRDINLNVGIWSTTGSLKMYFIGDDNELSTTSTYLMEQHKQNGWLIREETIPVRSLSDICTEYVPIGVDIHFLKVDVEGAEIEALKGHDFNRWRPWIILVESHEPERKSNHWRPVEDLLIQSGYLFTHCDGVNRFYIEKDRLSELQGAFEVPPNVYDKWVAAEELAWKQRCLTAEKNMVDAWKELEEAQSQVYQLRADFEEAQTQVYQLRADLEEAQSQVYKFLAELNSLR